MVTKLSDEIKAGIENQDGNLESARFKMRMTPTDVMKTSSNKPEDAKVKGKLESFEIELAGAKGKKVHEFKATSANDELKRLQENIMNMSNNKSGIMLLNTEDIELFDDLKVNFKLSDGEVLTLLDYEYLEQEGIEAVNYKISISENDTAEINLKDQKFMSVSLKFVNETDLKNEVIKEFLIKKFDEIRIENDKFEGRYFTSKDIKSEIEVLTRIVKPEDRNILINGTKIQKENTFLEFFYFGKNKGESFRPGLGSKGYIRDEQIALDVYIKDLRSGAIAVGLSNGVLAFISQDSIKRINYAYDQLAGIYAIPYHIAILRVLKSSVKSNMAVLIMISFILLIIYAFLNS